MVIGINKEENLSPDNPQISVIIVNFNSGNLIVECVKSVLMSTIPVEIFVIDNASIDQGINLLKSTIDIVTNHIHLIENKNNIGFAAASNQVLQQTQGNYLLFLNPDCLLQPDTLAQFQTVMDQYPHAGMAGGLVCNLDGSEQAGCRRSVPSPWRAVIRVLHLNKLFPQHPRFKSFVLTEEPLPDKPIEIEGISGACMFVRHTALIDVGPMDESYFLHCEDLDWFMRFRAKKWTILFIAHIKIIHVKGACSRNQPIKILWYKHRGMIKFYRKFFRHQYPIWVSWSVIIAVWTRFFLLATKTLWLHFWQSNR